MKIKYYIAAIALGVTMNGCDMIGNIDDIELKNVLTDENVITDSNSAETALNGVYGTWRNNNIGWFINHMSLRTKTLQRASIIGTAGFTVNSVKIDNEMIANNYVALYKVVNTANSVIAKMGDNAPKDLTKERALQIEAEARFHRALAHLMILRQYGDFYNLNSKYGVVLYEKPVRSNIPSARSTVADCYKSILNDLKFTSANAPVIPEGHYRISQLTSKALQSRVLLYMKDFAGASQLAGEVINNAASCGYELESDYLDIFRKRFLSSEVLFAPYTKYPTELSMMLINNFAAGTSLNKVSNELVPEEMDPRYNMAYSSDMVAMEGNYTTNTNKYMNPTFNTGDHQNTYFFMRLAEVYMIKAEADARTDLFDDARASLKVICDRAGYAPDYVNEIADADLKITILKHKWVELSMENNEEWFDLVRYRTWDNMAIAPTYVASDTHLTLPIPKNALAGNNLLEQNPSYN